MHLPDTATFQVQDLELVGHWFALAGNGIVIPLGIHPDYLTAFEKAVHAAKPYQVVWVINQDSARQWYDTIDAWIPYTPEEEADALLLERAKKELMPA